MKILVEFREDPRVFKFLEPIAKACKILGHHVKRWAGPLSYYTHKAVKTPPLTDVVIIWNGLGRYKIWKDLWSSRGTKLLIAELGWFPQGNTFQLDPQGFNMGASWANLSLPECSFSPWVKTKPLELLVLLQLDGDMQLAYYSPFFKNMIEFVSFLEKFSPLPLVVRRHPKKNPSPEVESLVNLSKKCRWDDSNTMQEALQKYDVIATINSSAAVEALVQKKWVLCFGKAVYCWPGAVVPLKNEQDQFQDCLSNPIVLNVGAMEAVWTRLQEKQWWVKDLPDRLERMLNAFK